MILEWLFSAPHVESCVMSIVLRRGGAASPVWREPFPELGAEDGCCKGIPEPENR